MLRICVLVWISLVAADANAELKLARVFSEHMVLQRDVAVPVWGTAQPKESITVEFQGQKKTAAADSAGKWMIRLDPLPASAEPSTLKARSTTSGVSAEVNDV